MADKRTALFWTIAWWFARRYLRRRAALAVAGVSTAAAARRNRLLGVVGALAIVGALVGAFVAWRALFARADASSESSDASAVDDDGVVPEGVVMP
jgi:hypothetical protein